MPQRKSPRASSINAEFLIGLFLALLPFGWDLSGLPPNILAACVIWALAGAAFAHAFWKWSSAWAISSSVTSNTVRAALITAMAAVIIWLMFEPVKNQYRSEHTVSFVFVKPTVYLFDQGWLFLVSHRGIRPVYNIGLFLQDRTKVPFNDIYQDKYDEVDKTSDSPRFLWVPGNADHESYDIRIKTRDMSLQQILRIEHNDGKWHFATKIVELDSSNKILMDCADTGFPADIFSPDLPACFPDFFASN